MKKKTYIIIALAIILILGAICVGAYRNRIVEDSMPYMIMVDGKIYQLNDYTLELPEDAVVGYIAKVVPGNKMPDENQTANFGEVGKQYWMYDNKIYIQTHTEYWVSDGKVYTYSNNEYNIFVPTDN